MGRQRSASTTTGLAELRGPRRWTEMEARRVLGAWEASGHSIATFSRGAGLDPQRLCWWRKRLTRGAGIVDAARAKSDASGPTFLPVSVRPTVGGGGAVVCVSNEGLQIEVRELDAASAAWVGAVVSTMKGMVS